MCCVTRLEVESPLMFHEECVQKAIYVWVLLVWVHLLLTVVDPVVKVLLEKFSLHCRCFL